MTAYLGTGEVREFIVPAAGAPDMTVAANFERFDGLDEPSLDHPADGVPFGVSYGTSPRPGQNNTPVSAQVFTPGPISGVVGVLGGEPWPVGNRRPPGANAEGAATLTPSRGVGGPKMGRQAYQGVAQTLALGEITTNPPQPGDLSSILAGLG